MVESNPLGLSGKTVGLFRKDITSPDRLRATTVGRKEILDDILSALKRNARKASNQHYIFIGPRGIGKTHFLTMLEDSVRSDALLNQRYTVIRFPEENNRILSFADFLLGVTELLAEENLDDNWRDFYQDIAEEMADIKIIDTILPRLKNYNKETGKKLLIFIENLNILFSQQIKKEPEIHRFRTFLMDSPYAVLVGTAASYFPGISDVGSPLYDFFDVQVLEEMSEDLTIELVKKNLEWDGRNDLIEGFKEIESKIRPLHKMTGGNPRLIMMLYELIANDNILAVKEQAQRLLDQVSPLYQERIKDLPPQERSLLETMAMIRSEARTPGKIAGRMRKSPQQVSSLLKRLTKAGYLSLSNNPDDKRSKIYRIKDGFFDLWLFMSESRANRRRFGYLVEFLAGYYTEPGERERKREELWSRLDTKGGTPADTGNILSLIDHLSEIGEPDERFWAKLQLFTFHAGSGVEDEAAELCSEIQRLNTGHAVHSWIGEQAGHWIQGKESLDIRKRFDQMIEQWRLYRTGDLERAAVIAHSLGEDFSSSGLHGIAIEMYRNEIENQTDPDKKVGSLFNMLESQIMDGRLDDALGSVNEAMAICKKAGDEEGMVTALNFAAKILFYQREYDSALDKLKTALHHCKKERSRAVTMGQIADIMVSRGDLDGALRIRQEEQLPVYEKIGDIDSKAHTLWSISRIEIRKKLLKQALDHLIESYHMNLQLGRLDGISLVGLDLGLILDSLGEKEKAKKILENAGAGFLKLGFDKEAKRIIDFLKKADS